MCINHHVYLNAYAHFILGFLQIHIHDGLLGKDFFLGCICFRSRRELIPVIYIRITVTFKDRETKKPNLDRWTIPIYSKPFSITRKKHSKFVRISPVNPNNQLMVKSIIKDDAKGTNNKRINGAAHLEAIKPKNDLVRKKRNVNCAEINGCSNELNQPPGTNTRNMTNDQQLVTSTPLASSTEQTSKTKPVNDDIVTESPTELTLISSTTNHAFKNLFSQISTEKTITTETESTSTTPSDIDDRGDTLGTNSSLLSSELVTHPTSLSTLILPSNYTANLQYNSRSTASEVTKTTLPTDTSILPLEVITQVDVQPGGTMSMANALPAMHRAPIAPDSGAEALPTLDTVTMLMLPLLTVLCLF